MDIRKFFGAQSAAKKTAETAKCKDDSPRTNKVTQEAAESVAKQPTNKVTPPQNDFKKVKQKLPDSNTSLKKRTSQLKKPVLEEDDSSVIVDVSDEEIVHNSQPTSNDGKTSHASRSKAEAKSSTNKNISTPKQTVSSKQSAVLSNGKKEVSAKDGKRKNNAKSEDENDFIEVSLSVNSADSSVSRSSSQKKGGEKNSSKGKDSDNSKGVAEKVRTGDSRGRSASKKKACVEANGGKSRKRLQISSDDEDDESIVQIDESADEQEEVISSKRRSRKTSAKKTKKTQRALDSDSDEESLPKDKPKVKRKKKEVITFVDDSDGEKKETALDKFLKHNASPNVQPESKKMADNPTKGKPVNVLDFFGAGTVARSDRATAVSKRKHVEVDTTEEIDLTFDGEEHDDDDFLKTLDELDGPSVKKAKQSEINEETTEGTPKAGSLASKLSSQMKLSTPDSAEVSEPAVKGSVSPAKQVTKSPVKAASSSKSRTKKGQVYSMEVTRIKPATVVVSSVSSKQEQITPSKKGVTPPVKKGPSPGKKEGADNNDDGFGTKAIGGFKAFKSRGGPQALGSRDPPEGAENCLEGLTFVLTGVLDTIERDDAKAVIEKHGGKVTGNISRKTSYVVVGREAGESKLSKARDMKVKQLDEDGLYELIKTLPGKTSKYEVQAKQQLKKDNLQKKIQQEKEDAAAKKLQSFRSEKDIRNTQLSPPGPSLNKCNFTQIKNSSETGAATSVPSPSSSKLLDQSSSPSHKQSVQTDSQSENLLWVDKHKPTNIKQIIGQQGDKSCARKLLHWLQSWHENVLVKGLKPSGNFFGRGDGAGCRAALLSGPPGIGKTTTATLVCQEVGFSYVELNASDTRSKRNLKEVVAESLTNQTLVDYMGTPSTAPSGQSHCLIMDEVDGMAGNEDRGGLQELVQLIKSTKIPILCICNDRNSMKMRTLSNYCLDLRFQRPRAEQIKGAMMSIAFREGVKIPPVALNEIIVASGHDIRQIIHNISMWSAGNKTLTFEQVKQDSKKAQKDIKLGPFDVCRKVFVNDEETRKMSIHDKSDLFFHDYSFGPLFVHENYPHIIPSRAEGNHSRHLSCLARAIDSICDGDLVDRTIRKEGNWNLLPVQAMYSSVIPGEVMRGSFPQMAEFPQWLGKFSTTNKTHRILQELGTHMRLEISCDKRGLGLDYLPALRSCLTLPLTSQGSEGVPEVIKMMDDYDIIKEDFDNIMEVTKWPNSFDPMSRLDTKTKAAFTRQYNKEVHMTPYATGVVGKKRRSKASAIDESDFPQEEGNEEAGADSEEEDEDVLANTMIKTKKPSASSKGQGGSKQTGAGKGKGGSKQAGAGKGNGKGSGKGKK